VTAAAVVAELSAMGVAVVRSDSGKIRLTVEVGGVPAEAVAMAREHKPALLDHLRPNCNPHNNPDNHIDTPDDRRPGWIRSKCRVCGRFVGYRRGDGR
jgi:hypothetical protein